MSSVPTSTVQPPRDSQGSDPSEWADSATSTGALVVELSQLEYADRARRAGSAGGSATMADAESLSLQQRRKQVVTELRRRGVDFGGGTSDESVRPSRGHSDSAPLPVVQPIQPVGIDADLMAKVHNLERGLVSRAVIGQAQGILMERHRITAAEAFQVLVKASNDTNRKLHDIAADLVRTGALLATPPSAHLGPQLDLSVGRKRS